MSSLSSTSNWPSWTIGRLQSEALRDITMGAASATPAFNAIIAGSANPKIGLVMQNLSIQMIRVPCHGR